MNPKIRGNNGHFFSSWHPFPFPSVLQFRLFSYPLQIAVVDAFTLTPGLGGIFLTTGYVIHKKLFERGMKVLGRTAMVAAVVAASGFFIVASVTVFTNDPNGTQVPLLNGTLKPSHRAVAWETAFEKFLENPILGYGVGMPVANSKFTDPSGNRQLLVDAHNTYISLLGETGIVGFAAFMSLIAFLTFGLLRMIPEDRLGQAVRLFFLLALCDAFFVQSLTGSFEDSRHLWAFFGIIAATIHLSRPQIAID